MPRAAFAIILNEQNEILLCHRRDYDLWNLPGGGIEAGESPREAVIREVKEETGLDVGMDSLVDVSYKKKQDEVLFTFLCSVSGGSITLNDEAEQIEYFSLDNFPKRFSPRQRERIEGFLHSPETCQYREQSGPSSIQLMERGEL